MTSMRFLLTDARDRALLTRPSLPLHESGHSGLPAAPELYTKYLPSVANIFVTFLLSLNASGNAYSGLSAADRKSTRLNSSHLVISYAVFCLKKKKKSNNNIDVHQL